MATAPSPAVGSRRGRQMPPSQTTVKSQQIRPRPPPPNHANKDPSADRTSPRTPLKSSSSKSSLKSLFMKAKSTRRSIYNNDPALPSIVEAQKPTAHISTLEVNSSRTNLGPIPASEIPLSPSISRSSKTVKTPKDKIHRTMSLGSPPPLFKAYPQSLKHATLPSPTQSADSIIRINGYQKGPSDRIDASTSPNKALTKRRKDEKKGMHHSRRTSEAIIGKAEWTRKIYMLMTSGFLLQYSGDGTFDRLPEKVLELEKNSAAFASDAIPGKPWVLQISHTLDDSSSAALDTKKNFLTRLGFSDTRRSTVARSLLLVLNSAEELASWLNLVRREIDILGGKEHIPETPLVEKPPTPHRFQSLHLTESNQKRSKSDLMDQSRHSISTANNAQTHPVRPRVDDTFTTQANRRSVRQSVESSSLSTMTTSTDPDRLRDASRFSYVSAGTRTIPSSRASSPEPSPVATKPSVSRNSCIESPKAMKTVVISSPPPEEADDSASISPSLVARPGSPPPPNFSLPIQGKRCSGSLNSRMHASLRERHGSPSPALQPAAPSKPNNDGTDTRFESSNDHSSTVGRRASDRPYRFVSYRSSHPGGHPRPPRPRDEDCPLLPSPPLSQAKVKQSRTRRYSSYENGLGKPPAPAFRSDLSTLRDDSSEDEVEVSIEPPPREPRIVPPRRPWSLQTHPRSHLKTTPLEGLSGTSSQNNTYTGLPGDLSPLEEGVTIGHSPTRRHSAKTIPPRKSMPQFSVGPPPAPPPDCPLPDVPPITVSQFTPPRSRDANFRSNRSSLQSSSKGSTDLSIGDSRRHTGTYFEYDCKDRLPTPAEINAKKASMVNAF